MHSPKHDDDCDKCSPATRLDQLRDQMEAEDALYHMRIHPVQSGVVDDRTEEANAAFRKLMFDSCRHRITQLSIKQKAFSQRVLLLPRICSYR